MFKPKFKISKSMLNNLSRIAEAKAVVQRAKLIPGRESFLKRWARVRITHSSTSIEGNVLREDQVEVVSKGGKVRAEKEQILEVKNYLKALGLVNDLAGRDGFDKREILSLHKLVMANLICKNKIGKIKESFKLGIKKIHHFIVPYAIIILLFLMVLNAYNFIAIMVNLNPNVFLGILLIFIAWLRYYFVEIVYSLHK